MRTLNSSNNLTIGSMVVLVKKYENGNIVLPVGTKGTITDIEIESFPDLNLFNIRILSFKFGKHIFAAGEDVIRKYVKKI